MKLGDLIFGDERCLAFLCPREDTFRRYLACCQAFGEHPVPISLPPPLYVFLSPSLACLRPRKGRGTEGASLSSLAFDRGKREKAM